MKSRRVLYQFGKAVFEMDANWRSGNIKANNNDLYDGDEAPSYDDWSHLPFNFSQKGGNNDIMAWNGKTNRPSVMRELEMAGILPDAFDFAYYSIEPDFYHNYYTRIRDGFLRSPYGNVFPSDRELPGDIGMHKGFKEGSVDYDAFSVKDQYDIVYKGSYAKMALDFDQKLTYLSKEWQHALTSWAPTSLSDYAFDKSKFGKCSAFTFRGGSQSAQPTQLGELCRRRHHWLLSEDDFFRLSTQW